MTDKTIRLGNKDYQLSNPGIKQSREWRKLFTAYLDQYSPRLLDALQDIGGMSTDFLKTNKITDIKIDELLKTIPSIYEVIRDVMNDTDVLVNLLCAYSPALETDKTRIDEEATDEELLKAIIEVVKMAYPFGSLKILSNPPGPVPTAT